MKIPRLCRRISSNLHQYNYVVILQRDGIDTIDVYVFAKFISKFQNAKRIPFSQFEQQKCALSVRPNWKY